MLTVVNICFKLFQRIILVAASDRCDSWSPQLAWHKVIRVSAESTELDRISLLKWSRLCWSVEISFPSSVGALTSGRFLCAIALLPAKSPCWQPPWPYKPAASQVVGETNIYVSWESPCRPCPWRAQRMKYIEILRMKLSWIGLNPSVAWNRALTRLLVIGQQSQCSWEVAKNGRWGVTWCNSYCNNCLGGWPLRKLQPSPVGNLWPWKLISVWEGGACVLRSHVVTGWAGVGCLIKWASYTTPSVNWPIWLLEYYWTILIIKYQHWLLGSACCFSHLGLCNSGALEFLFQGKE